MPQENATGSYRRWLAAALLAVFPAALTIAVYFPAYQGKPLLALTGHVDAGFCVYEFLRAGEVGMRFWEMGDDPYVGKPYPTGAAKHPALYEGLDFLLIGATASRWLEPEQAFCFSVAVLLAINGWIAGGLVYRETRSLFWSMISAALMVCCLPLALRATVHVNLLKVGYCLLAIWAYFGLVREPTVGRGVKLGLAMALVLQGSYYLAYLLVVGLMVTFLLDLIFRRIGVRQLAMFVVAACVFLPLAFAIAFPVLRQAKMPMANVYFERNLLGIWQYGAELWQYFRAYPSPVPSFNWGAMLFPGYAVLASFCLLAFARLRGWDLHGDADDPNPESARSVGPGVGQLAIVALLFVLLSLRGGPGVWLFHVVKAFRCYDRAGLIAVAVGIVLTGIVGARFCRLFPGHLARIAGGLAVAMTVVDVVSLPSNVSRIERRRARIEGVAGETARTVPGWAEWLKSQPEDVKLAAFGDLQRGDLLHDYWHWDSLYLRSVVHGHATLNGCELKLLDADLHLMGASYAAMNPDGLRFVASLGYRTLAFDSGYLAAHPWIASVDWLKRTDEQKGWAIYQVADNFVSLPTSGAEEIVRQFDDARERPAPCDTWITERIELKEPTVRTDASQIHGVWQDEHGKRLGKPEPVLAQRFIAGAVPAVRARTPKKPGKFSLLLLDEAGVLLAMRNYNVNDQLQRVVATAPERIVDVPSLTATELSHAKFVLRNRGSQFIVAKLGPKRSKSALEFHPALGDHLPTTTVFASTWTPLKGAAAARKVCMLPCDVPPYASVEIPLDIADGQTRDGRLVVGFEFVGPADRAVYATDFEIGVSAAQKFVAACKPVSTQGEHFETIEIGAAPTSPTTRTFAGDFDGDGKADLAIFDPVTGIWQVLFVDGKTKKRTARPWATFSTSVAWGDILVGDFTGDGRADVAALDSLTGTWYVAESKGDRFETSAWSAPGACDLANLQVADVDSDGRADICGVVNSGANSGPVVWLSRGTRFQGPLNQEQVAAAKRGTTR